jgi:hypothetical protein
MLKKLLGTTMKEVTERWRKLQSEELYNFYSSPNNIEMIKARKKIWTGM